MNLFTIRFRGNALICRKSRASPSFMMCPCRRWMLPRQEPRPAPHGFQTSPAGTGSKVGLGVLPIDSVTLRDERSREERTPVRYVPPCVLGLRDPGRAESANMRRCRSPVCRGRHGGRGCPPRDAVLWPGRGS